MATADHNLIDFTADSPDPTTKSFPDINADNNRNLNDVNVLVNVNPLTLKPGRANKSLFAITSEESHGDSVGGDDSELDETLSETHDSSSNSILENIKHSDSSPADNSSEPIVLITKQPNVVVIQDCRSTTLTSPVSISANVTVSTITQSTEPPSRFRIVKISKMKPYGKGKWEISDFKDVQKQTDTNERPSSPVVKRTRGNTESSGEHKVDGTKNVTSPTEPVKTKSSEFLVNHVLHTTQSSGSSNNSVSTLPERRSSIDSNTVVSDSSKAPIVTPVVDALETALASAMDQIQIIKNTMHNKSVSEEMSTLRDNLCALQSENNHLKEQNDHLKQKLAAVEARLSAIDKG